MTTFSPLENFFRDVTSRETADAREYIHWLQGQPEFYNIVRKQIGHHWPAFERFWREATDHKERPTWNSHIIDITQAHWFIEYVFHNFPNERKYVMKLVK